MAQAGLSKLPAKSPDDIVVDPNCPAARFLQLLEIGRPGGDSTGVFPLPIRKFSPEPVEMGTNSRETA